MRYEVSIALSYILPKKREFHIGFIGLLSSLTIAVIIWAVLVFFSVTGTFEKRWSETIISLLGPVQISPTPSYFELPENQIDRLSHATGFSCSRFTAIENSPNCTWDEQYDEPLPQLLHELQQASARGKPIRSILLLKEKLQKQQLNVSLCETAVLQASFYRPYSTEESSSSLQQYIYAVGRSSFSSPFSEKSPLWSAESASLFLKHISNRPQNQIEPFLQLYKAFPWRAICYKKRETGAIEAKKIEVDPEKGIILFEDGNSCSVEQFLSLYTIKNLDELPETWRQKKDVQELPLEYIPGIGYPIYVPKQLQQHGISLFSQGTISNSASFQNPSGIPIIVMGFFETGVLPIGSKMAILSSKLVTSLDSTLQTKLEDPLAPSSSFIISSKDKKSVYDLLTRSTKALKELPEEIQSCFTITTYRDYPSTKELFVQLHNEKNIFRLLSSILLAATAIQILSSLFILSHTKEKEIAIIQALGATPANIRLIFIISGLLLGLAGAIIGIVLSQITLFFLPEVMELLNRAQGHELLSSSLYGPIQRTLLNIETVLFALTITAFSSAIAGWIASTKSLHRSISDSLRA